MDIEYRKMDQQIWKEELVEWVPDRVHDVHQHAYKKPNPHCPRKLSPALIDSDGLIQGTVGLDFIRECDNILLRGRVYGRLLLSRPSHPCVYNRDAEDQLKFLADEAAKEPLTAASMLVTPEAQPEWLRKQLDRYHFVGLKPYYIYAEDPKDCVHITEMMPPPVLEVANDRSLLVTLHLAEKIRKLPLLNDERIERIKDLVRLSAKYPRIRWILAHCACCWDPRTAEKVFAQIKELPNIWYDISAIRSAKVMELLLATVPSHRIMYGSDGPYFGWTRPVDESGSDEQTTFCLYYQLQALGYALRSQKWDKQKIEDLFYNNAIKLIHGDTTFPCP